MLFSYARWDTLVARRSLHTKEALLAIRNELEIARRIQTSILPERMPEISGLQVAAQYVPMSQVAGDFYDFFLLIRKIAHRWVIFDNDFIDDVMKSLAITAPPRAEVNHPDAQAAGAASTSSRFFGTFGTTEVLNPPHESY